MSEEKVDLFDLLDRIKTGFHNDPIVTFDPDERWFAAIDALKAHG